MSDFVVYDGRVNYRECHSNWRQVSFGVFFFLLINHTTHTHKFRLSSENRYRPGGVLGRLWGRRELWACVVVVTRTLGKLLFIRLLYKSLLIVLCVCVVFVYAAESIKSPWLLSCHTFEGRSAGQRTCRNWQHLHLGLFHFSSPQCQSSGSRGDSGLFFFAVEIEKKNRFRPWNEWDAQFGILFSFVLFHSLFFLFRTVLILGFVFFLAFLDVLFLFETVGIDQSQATATTCLVSRFSVFGWFRLEFHLTGSCYTPTPLGVQPISCLQSPTKNIIVKISKFLVIFFVYGGRCVLAFFIFSLSVLNENKCNQFGFFLMRRKKTRPNHPS